MEGELYRTSRTESCVKKKHYMEKGHGGPDVPPLFLTLVPLGHSLPTCHVSVKKIIPLSLLPPPVFLLSEPLITRTFASLVVRRCLVSLSPPMSRNENTNLVASSGDLPSNIIRSYHCIFRPTLVIRILIL